MGWITRRFQSTGRAKWGRPISDEKRKAPLRRIVGVKRFRDGLFDSDYVILECGHEAEAWGSERARCVQCLKLIRSSAT